MMTLLQLNVVANSGSTGRITEEIGKLSILNGWKSYIAYGRWANNSDSHLIKIGRTYDVITHVLNTRLFDQHGFGSRNATASLINTIKKISPDIIHLHNLHGYYVNIELLFDYLSTLDIPIVWTLHDCWAMTGHCVHFQNINCVKWQDMCFDCPNINGYPSSWLLDLSKKNYYAKKNIFNSVKRLTIVPVCNWLDSIVDKSFLKYHNRVVIENGININKFNIRDVSLDFKKKIGVNDKFMILGVASVWNATKGFQDILELGKMLNDDEIIFLVGLTKKQIKRLPTNIIGICKTENVDELVDLYNVADVLINPTYEDTFPTVNIEAQACGTPVITYNTGGCIDTITSETGHLVKRGCIKSLYKCIVDIKSKDINIYRNKSRENAVCNFDMERNFNSYLSLYEKLLRRE